ncbi:MAG TPA: hypothetical protein VGR28_14185 [Candidatus Thermoplasmatota archaeon]|jgi:hypothetical protein|nr:hypothetical protein [Candidatus Thermoplasmatota archaeon]
MRVISGNHQPFQALGGTFPVLKCSLGRLPEPTDLKRYAQGACRKHSGKAKRRHLAGEPRSHGAKGGSDQDAHDDKVESGAEVDHAVCCLEGQADLFDAQTTVVHDPASLPRGHEGEPGNCRCSPTLVQDLPGTGRDRNFKKIGPHELAVRLGEAPP